MGAWEHAHPHPRARTLPSACHLCVQSPRRGDCPAPAPRTRPSQGLPGSRPDRRPRRPCAEAPAAGGHPTPGLGEGRDGARGGSPCSGGPPLPVLRGQREHTGTWGRNAKGATKPRCQSARLPGSRAGGPRQDSGARGLRAALPRRGLHRGARGLGPGVGGRGGRWGSFVTPDPTPPPAERPTVRGAAARPGCPPPRPRSATLASRLAGASARGYGAQPLLLGVASSSRSFILCCGPLSPPDNCDVSVPPGLSDAPSLLGFWWLRFSPIPLNRPQDEAAFIYSSRDAVISRPPELALHRCPRRPGLPLPRPAARGVRDRGYPRKEATQRKAVSVLHALF